ncbi:uncharacterized protein [Elaeis guineensis]|uniref:Zinc finger CCCH domain-containing protein 62 n=1 Tax=Elaeis guineensis var. tenera TaxID=51953 RepID=A0A6I9RGZ3_ELAGV|nr:zinc finger CCCH domain-containing protein 62 [Elaeis guineensis]
MPISKKGKRAIISISSSSSEEESEAQEDDSEEEEEDEESEEGEEESLSEDVGGSTEEEEDGDDADYDDEEEEEEEEEEDDDAMDGKPTDEELCNKVIDLLRRNKSLDILKLEECKAYLRKHGLRLSGTKATCIERILEHWRIKDGNGEKLYPRSSFVFNCTGDVCKGDVILFKQRVYEKFDKVTRGASIIGSRTIAGSVVKESYGAAKQQHTFTVEVLWSKGVKALPPLFPLLVKGRNLYRLKTFRQRWGNEAERSKVLAEKHRRGAAARHARAIVKAMSANKGSKRKKNCSTTRAPPKKRRKKGRCHPTKKQKQNMSIDKSPVNGHGKTKQLAMGRNLASLARNPRQVSYFDNGIHIQHPIPQRNPFSDLYNTQLELCDRNNIVPSEANRGIFGSHIYNAGNLLNVTGRSFNAGNYLNDPYADSHFHPRSSIHPSRPPEFHCHPTVPSGMRFRRWMP